MSASQPSASDDDGLGWRFWCLVPGTGVAAGLAAGLLIPAVENADAFPTGHAA